MSKNEIEYTIYLEGEEGLYISVWAEGYESYGGDYQFYRDDATIIEIPTGIVMKIIGTV